MNKKGGYQIIDLKDFNFTKDTNIYFFVDGDNYAGKKFFDNIIGKDKKPLLISNIVINGVEKNDVIISNYDMNGEDINNVYFNMYNLSWLITNDNATCDIEVDFGEEVI